MPLPKLTIMVTESRLSRILLWCGVVGPAFFVVSFLVQGAVRPGYDPLRHPVSPLSLGGGAAWVQSATFLITGLLVIAFAVGLGRADCGRWTPILIGLVGLGLMGAGVFTSDPINGYPPGTPIPAPRTTSGILHDQFSTPVFTALPAACLVMARRFGRQGSRGWRGYSIATAVASWICFILAAFGFNRIGPFVPTGGLWQRLCLIISFAWLVGLAWTQLRARQPISRQA